MAITNKSFEDGNGIPTGWTLTTAGTDSYAEFNSFGGGVESFYWGWNTEDDVFDWTLLLTSPRPAEFDSSVNTYETWAFQYISDWTQAGGLFAMFNKKLPYDNQPVGSDFTVGLYVTGGLSGSTGKIVRDEDYGLSGLLTLINATGAFINNEALTDTGLGNALANITGSEIGEDPYESFELFEWFTSIPSPVTAMFGGGVNAYESFEGIWWLTLPAPASAQFDDKWGGGGALQPYENFEP